jgi:hypothetical protein
MLDGKFILATDPKFVELKNSQEFYSKFFKESFGFDLELKSDYAYILSSETNEQLSRDICIFFGLLCYEMDKDGKNFLEEVQYAEFDMDIIDHYFENSSYIDLIQNNNQLKNTENRKQFVNTLGRRNIIEKTNDKKFSFTPAYKVFMDFAANFAKGKLSTADAEAEVEAE